MKLTEEEIKQFKNAFFRSFITHLNDMIGDRWNIRFKVHNPRKGDKEDTKDIDKNTALILWGDECSQIFPTLYHQSSGAIIKCYCPEAWIQQGIIPMTDNAMIYEENEAASSTPCSQRPYTVFYSANLNYRRTDLYRGLTGKNYGWPFRISSNYPQTGKYPLWHKIEAVMMHRLITKHSKQLDFSDLYPNSYIRFHNGFMKGTLPQEEYEHRMKNSKLSWCTAGFMTNETSRLLESAYAGTAVICGNLPDTPIYRGHPFVIINDWRKIRQVTDSLLNTPSRLDEIGTLGKQWFNTHFSPKAQAERIAKILAR